jgi:hypothetical protein
LEALNGISVAHVVPKMLAAERLFRRSDSIPMEGLEWTITLGSGAIGAEAYTLAVLGPNDLRPKFDADHVFTQPSSREVATKLYTALAMLRQWAPYAMVTVTFGDYAPALEIHRARELAGKHRDQVVVIEGESSDPDRRGDLVCVGTVRALWDLGRAGAPALIDLMEDLVPLIDSEDEDAAITAIYSLAPVVDFTREILERSPERVLSLDSDLVLLRSRVVTVREVPPLAVAS